MNPEPVDVDMFWFSYLSRWDFVFAIATPCTAAVFLSSAFSVFSLAFSVFRSTISALISTITASSSAIFSCAAASALRNTACSDTVMAVIGHARS